MSAKDLLPFIPNITMYPRKHLKDKIMLFVIIKKGHKVLCNIYIKVTYRVPSIVTSSTILFMKYNHL